ncbi:MAG: histidine kinase dimerization/phospho-acceptor domain-containing protein, partial [Clostridia bacterium]|nr:histidine kinase dimerization/phospho-acceptor domain-containing protein [Clostridia bacterium]
METGNVIAVTAKSYITHTAFAGVIIPALLIALLIYALSSIISLKLTENIVKPIEDINPLDGNYDNAYDEIKPFIKRITYQNRKIKEQMKTLSETEKIRREFSSNVSHELKTPLTTIHGYAQLINSGMAKEEDILGFTEKIEKETKRLITLTEDITKLSRLDENEQPEDKEKIDI